MRGRVVLPLAPTRGPLGGLPAALAGGPYSGRLGMAGAAGYVAGGRRLGAEAGADLCRRECAAGMPAAAPAGA